MNSGDLEFPDISTAIKCDLYTMNVNDLHILISVNECWTMLINDLYDSPDSEYAPVPAA